MYVSSFNGGPAVSYNDSSLDDDISDCMNEQDVGYHVLYSGEGSELLSEYQKTDNEIIQWSGKINKIMTDDKTKVDMYATGIYHLYTYGSTGCQCCSDYRD